jgi:hypothetical protein
MQPIYYIGLDVHKRKISYCVKDGRGQMHAEGPIPAARLDLTIGCARFRSRVARRWKPRCSRIASTPARFATACGAIFCRRKDGQCRT